MVDFWIKHFERLRSLIVLYTPPHVPPSLRYPPYIPPRMPPYSGVRTYSQNFSGEIFAFSFKDPLFQKNFFGKFFDQNFDSMENISYLCIYEIPYYPFFGTGLFSCSWAETYTTYSTSNSHGRDGIPSYAIQIIY